MSIAVEFDDPFTTNRVMVAVKERTGNKPRFSTTKAGLDNLAYYGLIGEVRTKKKWLWFVPGEVKEKWKR